MNNRNFGAYYAASERFLTGEPLYTADKAYIQEQVPATISEEYFYPPIFAALFAPMTLLPFTTAGYVWFALQLLTVSVAAVALLRALDVGVRWWHTPLVAVALYGFNPLANALKSGQVTPIMTAAFFAAAAAREHQLGDTDSRWGSLSGALTTLGTIPKLTHLPSGAHLLADRRRLAGAFGFGAVLLLVSVLVAGIELNVLYIGVLEYGKGWGLNRESFFMSHWVYKPLFVLPTLWAAVVRAGVVVSVVVLGVFAGSDDRNGRALFALGVFIIPLVTPRGSALEFIPMLPGIVLLAYDELRANTRLAAVVLLAVPALVLQPLALWWLNSAVGLSNDLKYVAQLGLYANLALVGVAAYRVLRPATGE